MKKNNPCPHKLSHLKPAHTAGFVFGLPNTCLRSLAYPTSKLCRTAVQPWPYLSHAPAQGLSHAPAQGLSHATAQGLSHAPRSLLRCTDFKQQDK